MLQPLRSPTWTVCFAVLMGRFHPSRLYHGTLESMTKWKDSLDSKQSNETPKAFHCVCTSVQGDRQKESSSLTLWETPMGLHLGQPSSLTPSLKLQQRAIRLFFNIKTNVTRTKSTKSSQSDSHVTQCHFSVHPMKRQAQLSRVQHLTSSE